MKRENNRYRIERQSGFTLLEIMVVVVIIGILATFVVQKLADKPDAARVTRAQADITTLESALAMYRLDNHRYPSVDDGIQSLTQKPADAPSWKEGGYIERLPNDPWGNEYQYLNPGTHGTIDVFSFGADGQEGGEGVNADIGNWILN